MLKSATPGTQHSDANASREIAACVFSLPSSIAGPVIKETLRSALVQALKKADLPVPADGIDLEPPKRRDQGDWSTNIAMKLRAVVGRPPIDIAQLIADALTQLDVAHLAKVEVAPPGFVNLYLAPSWLHDVLRAVVLEGTEYGR